MHNSHLDMNELVQRILVKTPARPTTLSGTGCVYTLTIEDGKATPWDKIGPAQRESLLAFVMTTETQDALAHAEGDNIVYDALGEHRILGKAKKKKGKMSSPRY